LRSPFFTGLNTKKLTIARKITPIPLKSVSSFFEMVYLISGKGVVSINGNRMAYRDGNLLLLTPNDRHNWQSPQQVSRNKMASA
jgi:quercetin dioxygenase-like cupin family protein